MTTQGTASTKVRNEESGHRYLGYFILSLLFPGAGLLASQSYDAGFALTENGAKQLGLAFAGGGVAMLIP